MRVLMLHNFYRQPGGEDSCFFAEAEMLRQHGNQVETVEVHNDETQDLSTSALAINTLWSRDSYSLVSQRIARFRPDVLHCHNIFPLLSPSVYYAARRASVPVVQTLHNYRLLCLKATFFRQGKPCEACANLFVPWHGVLRRCYHGSIAHSVSVASLLVVHRVLGTWQRQVDLFVAVSAFTRTKYLQSGFEPDRIVVKPNVLSVEPRIGRGDGGYGLIVGRLSEEKGLATVLAAWRLSPSNPPLLIVGDGPLRSLEQDVSADSSVRFLGHRSRAEVYELLGRAAFLIAASEWYETFGLAIVEALACGTPVIAAHIGAFTELIEEGVTGLFFRPGDIGSLQNAVDRIIASPFHLRVMRESARNSFVERFGKARNYDALIEIYLSAQRAMRASRGATSASCSQVER
jgi:glycosyltransferase involved in cell wall biosynthesis